MGAVWVGEHLMPQRIQRRRVKGWRAPAGAKYVGRGTRYGNPWGVVRMTNGWSVIWSGAAHLTPGDLPREVRAETQMAAHGVAVKLYRAWLIDNPRLVERGRRELAGHDLMCWCPQPLECHVDAWFEVLAGGSARQDGETV